MNVKIGLGALMMMVVFFAAETKAQKNKLDVYALDRDALVINKAKLKSGDKAMQLAFNKLIKVANTKMEQEHPYTVMEKKQVPPSNDLHDYMSIALYYWPDPSKPDGLPYISKDGQINPEVEDYKDKVNIGKMVSAVSNLSLAYWFSDDRKYSQKTIEQLRAWFLDPSTKMNPNLNFAQAIKGKNNGRGIGIIESRLFTEVVDAVGLIKSDPNWSKKDQEGMEQWFADYLQWLITSKNGIEEYKANNNHGVWYDTQKLSFALFCHKNEIAKSTVESLKRRIEDQMDTSGFFPLELKRTISLHYSAFIIEPLFLAAQMSLSADDDLWNYNPASGKSLKKAFDVLMPYLSKEKEWFGQQIKAFDFSVNATPLLAKGLYKYHCKTCREGIYRVCDNPDESNTHLTTLID